MTDEELTALALAADLDAPLAPDAVPIDVYLGLAQGPLPDWYMPPVTTRRSGHRRRLVILAVVGAFLLIEGLRPVQHLRPIAVPLSMPPQIPTKAGPVRSMQSSISSPRHNRRRSGGAGNDS